MTAIEFTPVHSIPKIIADSRATFLTHRTQSLEFRKQQLRALLKLIEENADDLSAAIKADLNRSADFEIPTCIRATKDFIDNLEKYTENQKGINVADKDDSYVRLSPLGTVLVIGAWNFPIMLVVEPLAGALAAGNTVILKPSENSEHSAKLLTRLIEKYMDPTIVSVINGAVEETTVLLEQRFDHIIYTGGTQVGRIVMQAAAKHLTPVTLELGGKCPAIITSKADIPKAAQKIAGWKTANCGQICLTVDYVLCPKDLQESLIQNIIGTWQHMFGANIKDNKSYPKIINKRQHARLEGLLKAVKAENKVVYGGNADVENLYIEPTIVTGVSLKDTIMQDEIFGPILPIVTSESLAESINIINSGEHPLGLYLFTEDKQEVEEVLSKTRSGAAIVNDVASHFLNHSLPFGGVGNSGMGRYHGKYSIEAFSHQRAVMVRSSHL
ncbi:aldehyde dehydrogenase 3, member A2 [Mortierella hygrophila]|uniref:Aldehyde dehydrogenase n=1 Tax=Mortierella hygrophila TaxID=979708 RepID=A0A9P6F7I6_9FUNG|nr:aldehyde dehydrogenase 3, member A2 [Mortierella hygrophila]